MIINGILKRSLIGFIIVMMVPFGALSQETANQETATSDKPYNEAQLDQMLAPIALYPDGLLDNLLDATSFPDQVAEANQWVSQNANLPTDQLNADLDNMNWDPSVKALAAFPEILTMMVDQSGWTQKLGQACSSEVPDIVASIQRLRSQAYAEGNLDTSAEQQVVVKGDSIEIDPTDPGVVYVPRYDPQVVYGTWGWPQAPPLVLYPAFPVVDTDVGVFGFFGGVVVGASWGGGGWHGGGSGGGFSHGGGSNTGGKGGSGGSGGGSSTG
ncbi:MAG: DUF3300 domain-containing protein, partial [Syntrophobacteraceae bacterium]